MGNYVGNYVRIVVIRWKRILEDMHVESGNCKTSYQGQCSDAKMDNKSSNVSGHEVVLHMDDKAGDLAHEMIGDKWNICTGNASIIVL
jgi:hypothetical protein